MPTPACAICSSATEPAGAKRSDFCARVFALAHCPACRYSFVVDPCTDYAALRRDESGATSRLSIATMAAFRVLMHGNLLSTPWGWQLCAVAAHGPAPSP